VSRYGRAIRYLRQENRGKSAALNVGVAATKGEAIIVLDDDDVLPPTAVARHAEALKRDPAADFSYGRFVRFRGDTVPDASKLLDREPVPTYDPRRLVVRLMNNCFLPNPTWAVRRNAQLRVGPYDESMYHSQDYDMVLRLSRTNEGAFVDDTVLFQRKHKCHRGPISERTYTADSVEQWIKYDALIFKKIDREWGLTDFRPFQAKESAAADQALALLQRGVILFQRKVYDGAIRALAEYRRHLDAGIPSAEEFRIAAGLLGCRYGIVDLVAGGRSTDEAIRFFRTGHWPVSMCTAFASQVRWRIRAALAVGDAHSAFNLVQFSWQAFGTAATVAVLVSRYDGGARLWRRSESRWANFMKPREVLQLGAS
jgi:hypothetical protein